MSKYIRMVSDLHNEFNLYEIEPLPEDNETVLVLAGDIDLAKSKTLVEFLEKASKQFQDVVYVFGNHEYYKTNFVTPIKYLKDDLLSLNIFNVHILEKECIVINDIAFIGATLWSDFDNLNPITMFDANRFMADYKHIRNGPVSEPWRAKLAPLDVAKRHMESKEFIFSECKKHKEKGLKVVVVTHHSPSFQSVTENFRGDTLNGAYHSQLDEAIIEAKPDIWFHGHIHQSINYDIETTKVFTNPRGYYPSLLNPLFNPLFRILL